MGREKGAMLVKKDSKVSVPTVIQLSSSQTLDEDKDLNGPVNEVQFSETLGAKPTSSKSQMSLSQHSQHSSRHTVAPSGAHDGSVNGSSTNRETTDDDLDGPTKPKRRMTLQQKAKSEGINPVGILMVIVILGCILACPYNTAKDHLNYFDYFMLVITAGLFGILIALVFLSLSSDE